MKKTIITVIVAILSGICMGLFFFKKFDVENIVLASNTNSIYAVQVGVFKNILNAKEYSKLYNGIMVNDKDLYRVYINFIKSEDILEIMKNYYDSKNINYYIKKINVSNNFLEVLNDYEIVLRNQDVSSYDITINNVLKEYLKYEENETNE